MCGGSTLRAGPFLDYVITGKMVIEYEWNVPSLVGWCSLTPACSQVDPACVQRLNFKHDKLPSNAPQVDPPAG